MIGLVFATIEEAQPLIDRVEAHQITDEPFIVYSLKLNEQSQGMIRGALFRKKTAPLKPPTKTLIGISTKETLRENINCSNEIKGILIICGVGKVAAALATQVLILKYQPSAVINIGICGTTQTSDEVGRIYQVSETREGDLYEDFAQIHQCDLDSISWDDIPVGRLITRDQPVYDEALRRESAEWGLLVDMEGAAVVRTCHKHKVPCALLKGVTDFANADGKDSIKRNINMVSKKLADLLIIAKCKQM